MAKIQNIPMYERPYEKLFLYGEESLSESELLAIIIKNGTQKLSALEIAQKIIFENSSRFNNLKFLQQISIEKLMRYEGIGKVKAIQIKAACELAKRIGKPINKEGLEIHSREDVVNIFIEEMRYELTEVMKVVLLNNQNIIQKIQTIAIGNSNGITLDIKQILSEPVKLQIPRIIILHNHPSGNPEPSKRDIVFTEKLDEVSRIMGIELLDHIIIGDGIYKNINLKG